MLAALLFLAAETKIEIRTPRYPRTVVGGAMERRVREYARRNTDWIKAEAAKDPGARLPYELSMATENRVLTPGRASAVVTTYVFTGGAHGMTTFRTFNVRAGAKGVKDVRLGDLFTTRDWLPVVSTALMTKLRDNPAAMWVESGEFREFTPETLRAWTHERDGSLRFYFEPYLLGPYANGTFEVSLSRSDLGSTYRG